MTDNSQVNLYEVFDILNFKYIVDIIEKPIPLNKIAVDLKESHLGRPLVDSDFVKAKQSFLDNRTQLTKICHQIDHQNEMLLIFNLFKIFVSQKGYIDYYEEFDFLTPKMYFDVSFKNTENNEDYLYIKMNEQGKNKLYCYQSFFKQLLELNSIPKDGIQI